jgi:hypothetical protein
MAAEFLAEFCHSEIDPHRRHFKYFYGLRGTRATLRTL